MLLNIILNGTIIIISCNIVITKYFWEEKKQTNKQINKLCYDLVLICDSLSFYAHVHTCSPSYTDEE